MGVRSYWDGSSKSWDGSSKSWDRSSKIWDGSSNDWDGSSKNWDGSSRKCCLGAQPAELGAGSATTTLIGGWRLNFEFKALTYHTARDWRAGRMVRHLGMKRGVVWPRKAHPNAFELPSHNAIYPP